MVRAARIYVAEPAKPSLNEAELFYDASMEPWDEPDIVMHVTINRGGPDAEMGRKLLKLVDACAAWKVLPE
jgi:hypothetical protein